MSQRLLLRLKRLQAGSGALGGGVRYIEKQPDLSAYDASASFEVSGTDHGGANFNADGVLNLPRSKGNLALRIGAQAGHDSGYIDQVSPAPDLRVIAIRIHGNR